MDNFSGEMCTKLVDNCGIRCRSKGGRGMRNEEFVVKLMGLERLTRICHDEQLVTACS